MSVPRCPHCQLALTPEETRGTACPVCGTAFPETPTNPAARSAAAASPGSARRPFAAGLAVGIVLALAGAGATWQAWPAVEADAVEESALPDRAEAERAVKAAQAEAARITARAGKARAAAEQAEARATKANAAAHEADGRRVAAEKDAAHARNRLLATKAKLGDAEKLLAGARANQTEAEKKQAAALNGAAQQLATLPARLAEAERQFAAATARRVEAERLARLAQTRQAETERLLKQAQSRQITTERQMNLVQNRRAEAERHMIDATAKRADAERRMVAVRAQYDTALRQLATTRTQHESAQRQLAATLAKVKDATKQAAALERTITARKAALAKLGAPASVAAPFLRSWLVIGPFPNANRKGTTAAYAPEMEAKVDPNRAHVGLRGTVVWRGHVSPTDYVDLANVFNGQSSRKERGQHGPAVGYAACWVRSDRARPVQLSLGSSDGIKVWVNRRQVASRRVDRSPQPGQDRAACELTAGWNELLVKIDNQGGSWGFFLELREPNGAPLPGLEVRTTPP